MLTRAWPLGMTYVNASVRITVYECDMWKGIRQLLSIVLLASTYFAYDESVEAQLPTAQHGAADFDGVRDEKVLFCLASRSLAMVAGGPSRVSDYRQLVGRVKVPLQPPDGRSDIQEAEWWIGCMAGGASICGYYSKAAKVRALMSRSPYFKDGHSDVMGYDYIEGCARISSSLDEVLENRDQWEAYLDATYPAQ